MSIEDLQAAHDALAAAAADPEHASGHRRYFQETADRLARALTAPPAPEPYRPRRGDAIEAYIKGLRDGREVDTVPWRTLDAMLQDYRLRADHGLNTTDPIPAEASANRTNGGS